MKSFRNILAAQYKRAQVFLRTSVGAAVFLFLAAVAAIVCANTGLSHLYHDLLHVKIGISVGEFKLVESLGHWVNDGLMAVFFLMVGLEIKRELLTGELSRPSWALLPAIAAIGGMVVPALIFTGFNLEDPVAMRGWAVPMATDIAFSLGVLALLGSRVPLAVKVFLTAVAVIDDLGAIAIIAIFYSESLQLGLIGFGAGVVALMLAMNFLGVKVRLPYMVLGLLLWILMLKSGLHATLAGVLTALCIPHGKADAGSNTPLMSLEHDLHTPVAYFIMPMFAFANAGLGLQGLSVGQLFQEPLSAGILFGLLLGKPIGICLAVWIAIRLGLGELPRGCNWWMMKGISFLCGIGFTVSLFIGNLGFQADHPDLLDQVKAGVLAGSVLAGVVGYLLIHKTLSRSAPSASS